MLRRCKLHHLAIWHTDNLARENFIGLGFVDLQHKGIEDTPKRCAMLNMNPRRPCRRRFQADLPVVVPSTHTICPGRSGWDSNLGLALLTHKGYAKLSGNAKHGISRRTVYECSRRTWLGPVGTHTICPGKMRFD